MMTLMFMVCLIDMPDKCEQREMQIFETVTPMACVMSAPAELARWRGTHPNWRIARWACRNERVAASR